MEKEKILSLWQPGDDAAIANKVGVSRQAVRYWRIKGKTSEYDEAILAACLERFRNRKLVRRLVPVEMELPTA